MIYLQIRVCTIILQLYVTDLMCKPRDNNVGQNRNSVMVNQSLEEVAKLKCLENNINK
jgi:hypothetical protein